jgi:hypothetical protein
MVVYAARSEKFQHALKDTMADQKFQLRYSASEDRVLILSGTGPADMQCYALTRRMVGQLWPGLNRVIGAIAPRQLGAATAQTGRPAASNPAQGLEPAGDDGATATPQDTASLTTANPFGAPPPSAERHLVRKLQLVDRGERPRLLILTAADAELRVPLDSHQLAKVYEALRIVIERAEWGIDLDAGLPDASSADRPRGRIPDITAESPSRYRH